MLFSSLRSKLFILLNLTFFILLTLNFYLNYKNITEHTHNNFENSNYTLTKLITNYSNKYEDTKNLINSIENIYIQNVYLLDSQGKILFEKSSSVLPQTPYPFYTSLLKEKNNTIINPKQYLSMKKISLSNSVIAYIVVEGNMNQYHIEINQEVNLLILYSIFYALVSIISSIIISRSIAKPLEDIVAKIQYTAPNEELIFNKQPQIEYEYLADTIKTKHDSLYKLNIHLEDEVTQKTLELKHLNTSLEKRIEEAIFDLQRKEKLLREQSRHAQMGEMIAMIAHQWRQPLSAISTTAFSIMLKSKRKKFDFSTPEAQNTHLKYIEKNIENIQTYVKFLSQTIDDFRNFFKPEKFKEYCLINHLVSNALQIIKVPMNNNNIEIKTILNSVQSLKLFKNEITQVVLNILKNSEDNFIEKRVSGGEVLIYTYDQEKQIVLEISDNGGGIDESHIEKIFDPYFSTKKEKNGTGLGLYMAKVIIEEHNGGTLKVENRDKGVCFIITFNL